LADRQQIAAQAGGADFYAAAVFMAADLTVISGANAGDPLPLPGHSVTGDYYRLTPAAVARNLAIALGGPVHGPVVGAVVGRVAQGSDLGAPGAALHLAGQISLMADDGDLVEVLVLTLDGVGRLALPLSPLRARQTYTLIGQDAGPSRLNLAATVAGAFARGTRIAMASGGQAPVEGLKTGDLVLTRDHGAQVLRWIGAVEMRAEGAFAPVSVAAGVMGNLAPLTVSPHHRLFLYRPDARGLTGAAELLVQARHLVDDRGVKRLRGGHVEYFGLVFDHHEVIYAEGVPCESLRVSPATLAHLPAALAEPLRNAFPGLEQRLHIGAEVAADMLARMGGRA